MQLDVGQYRPAKSDEVSELLILSVQNGALVKVFSLQELSMNLET